MDSSCSPWTSDCSNVPVGLTILDPLKVVPVGNLLFNREQLASCADNVHEYDVIKAVIDGVRDPDPVISQLMVAPYTPDEVESRMLADDGINPARLFLLNRNNVWRHTDTRSQYQRFATVRLKSCFESLDLKQQLRAMDRRSPGRGAPDLHVREGFWRVPPAWSHAAFAVAAMRRRERPPPRSTMPRRSRLRAGQPVLWLSYPRVINRSRAQYDWVA